ncbi:MAG: hypothetical protein AB7R89_21800 [Dehalococcoidia bacterium]
MDRAFSNAVAEWNDFHTLLGTGAFTLLGLLFVAVSLRLNIFRQGSLADIRDFALLTFANFLSLTIIALLFFVPSQNKTGMALPLFVIGALGLLAIVLLLQESRRVNTGAYTLKLPQEAWFGASALPYGGLVAIAVALLLDSLSAFYWLAAVEISLLLISSFNTWALLSRAQPDSGSGDPQTGV